MARKAKTELTENELLAAIAAEIAVEALRPDDITRQRVAALAGCSEMVAYRRLLARVHSGELIQVTCFDPDTRRRTTAYRLPTPPPKPPRPIQMMRCPKCKAHIPRTPPVCPNCGADTRRRKL